MGSQKNIVVVKFNIFVVFPQLFRPGFVSTNKGEQNNLGGLQTQRLCKFSIFLHQMCKIGIKNVP